MGFELDEWDNWVCEYVDDEEFDFWTDQNGVKHGVAEMAESHIKNIIRRIETCRFRQAWLDEYGDNWLRVLRQELKRRKSK